MDILTLSKTLLRMQGEDTTNDEILNALILVSKMQVFTACNRSEADLDDKLSALIAEIAVIRYRRLGAEGKMSSGISVISNSFYGGTADLPD